MAACDLFQRADRLRADLLASTTEPVVLHGDLHHFNILSATRAPWLAIDPKGLLGDRAFDACQLLLNPIAVPVEVNQRDSSRDWRRGSSRRLKLTGSRFEPSRPAPRATAHKPT